MILFLLNVNYVPAEISKKRERRFEVANVFSRMTLEVQEGK